MMLSEQILPEYAQKLVKPFGCGDDDADPDTAAVALCPDQGVIAASFEISSRRMGR